MPFNIEAALAQFLAREMGEVAGAEVPNTRPKRFITVERTGGARSEHRDLPQIAVQWWAESRFAASEFAISGGDVLERFAFEPGVARCRVGGTYNFPDPDSKQARYQTVIDVVTKD